MLPFILLAHSDLVFCNAIINFICKIFKGRPGPPGPPGQKVSLKYAFKQCQVLIISGLPKCYCANMFFFFSLKGNMGLNFQGPKGAQVRTL